MSNFTLRIRYSSCRSVAMEQPSSWTRPLNRAAVTNPAGCGQIRLARRRAVTIPAGGSANNFLRRRRRSCGASLSYKPGQMDDPVKWEREEHRLVQSISTNPVNILPAIWHSYAKHWQASTNDERPSVGLSHAGIVSKWTKLGSPFHHRRIAIRP